VRHGREREETYGDAYVVGEHWIYGDQCCAQYCLANEPDFLEQREWLRQIIEDRGHSILYYPKYHCELNYIEMVWAYLKGYLRRNCSYNFNDLKNSIPTVLENHIPLSFVRRVARHCYRTMDAYRQGLDGLLLDYALKVYKSHRRIPLGVIED
jgi:hypothetical protein